MTTSLEKSSSFAVTFVSFVNYCQLMCKLLSVLVLKVGIWDLVVLVPIQCLFLYFLIIYSYMST